MNKSSKAFYNNFKLQIVNKYYDMFPLYTMPDKIIDEFALNGYNWKDKKEGLIITLNNLYFKQQKEKK